MVGCAKGAGMIHPNMATMLAFVVTDAAIAPALLQKTLRDVTSRTFNAISDRRRHFDERHAAGSAPTGSRRSQRSRPGPRRIAHSPTRSKKFAAPSRCKSSPTAKARSA